MHPGNYQDLGTTELIQGMISLDVFFDSTFEAVPQINVIVFSLGYCSPSIQTVPRIRKDSWVKYDTHVMKNLLPRIPNITRMCRPQK